MIETPVTLELTDSERSSATLGLMFGRIIEMFDEVVKNDERSGRKGDFQYILL